MQPVNESFPSLRRATRHVATVVALWLAGTLACAQTAGQAAEPAGFAAPMQRLVQQQAAAVAPAGTRVEVEVGAIDPRLKLAACARIVPRFGTGTRLWGRTQVGLRCVEGARWQVFLPVTVKVFALAWTATRPLAAGTVLSAEHLARAEVDLAAEPSPAVTVPEAALGRSLARTLHAGQAVREADLKPRQWFAAGDAVRVTTAGSGFAISAQGQALNAGIDGQTTKVRTDGGRIVQGRAIGAHLVEMTL